MGDWFRQLSDLRQQRTQPNGDAFPLLARWWSLYLRIKGGQGHPRALFGQQSGPQMQNPGPFAAMAGIQGQRPVRLVA